MHKNEPSIKKPNAKLGNAQKLIINIKSMWWMMRWIGGARPYVPPTLAHEPALPYWKYCAIKLMGPNKTWRTLLGHQIKPEICWAYAKWLGLILNGLCLIRRHVQTDCVLPSAHGLSVCALHNSWTHCYRLNLVLIFRVDGPPSCLHDE